MINLYVYKGPNMGRSFEFKSDTIYIGRSPKNDLQIKDPLISRRHLKVSQKDQKYKIMDMHSANGTIVGDCKLEPNIEVDVEEGIPISIGTSVFSLGKKFVIVCWKDREIEKNLNLIYSVSSLLKESLKLNEILDKIMNYIFDLLIRIDRIFIIIIDNKTMGISEIISKSRADHFDKEMEYNQDIVDKVIEDKKAVMMSDTYSKEDIEYLDSLELIRTGSVICVPLISSSKIHGVIYLDTIGKTHGFRSEDLELLNALGSIIAFIIKEKSLQL
ncbi:MAG: FHA domain-containing protein [Deltaproteobacteria bacterium]|nr:FHA domain-containing protein [Deltaproteobacteria bacterium]